MNPTKKGNRPLEKIFAAILMIFMLNTAQASHNYLQLEKVKQIGKQIAILSYCIENVWLKENAPQFIKLRDELRGYDYSFEISNEIPDNIANDAFLKGVDLGTRMAHTYRFDRSRCIEQYVTSVKFLESEKQE